MKKTTLLLALTAFSLSLSAREFVVRIDSEISQEIQDSEKMDEGGLFLDSESYEIEFLEREDSHQGDIQPFQGSIFRQNVPTGKPYFRVRRIGKHGAQGFWTEVRAVEDFLEKPPEPKKEEPKIQEPVVEKSEDVFLELETDGKKLLYLNGKAVSIQPSSKGSVAIAKTIFRLNHGKWQEYNHEKLEFEKDGEYQMDYYSIDILGNREPPQSVIFLVDNKPPKTKLEFPNYTDKAKRRRYTAGTSTIHILAEDEVSGIEKTFYRQNCRKEKESDFQEYSQPLKVQELVERCGKDFNLEYFSIDKVGNKEFTKLYPFSYNK